jgi:hypothetical protein
VFRLSEAVLSRAARKCLNLEILKVPGDKVNSEKIKDFIGLTRDLFDLVRERRKYWLAPLIFALLVIGTLIFALEGTIVAPLIYTIF